MAVIPQIETSTRRVEASVPTFVAKSYHARNLGAVSDALGAVGDSLLHIGTYRKRMEERRKAEAERAAAVKARSDEREGEYSLLLAEDFVKNGFHGCDIPKDGGGSEHRPGVLDATYDQLQRERKTLGDKTVELLGSVYGQDFVTRLTPDQRKVFDRKFAFVRSAYLRSAEAAHQRLTKAHIAAELKEMIERRAKAVEAAYGSTEGYAKAARWAATQNMKDIASSEVENPEVFDDPNLDWETAIKDGRVRFRGGTPTEEQKTRMIEQYRQGLFEYDVARIGAFQKAGATGTGMTMADGSTLSPSACLDMADGMTERLRGYRRVGKNPATGEAVPYMTERQANALKAVTGDAREKLKALQVEANRADYNGVLAQVGEIELGLLDPNKVTATGNGLNYEAFCSDLAKNHPGLTANQSVSLRKHYRQLCDYYRRYSEDVAKHLAAVAEASDKQRSMYGWFKEGRTFVPASSFADKSDYASVDEFKESSATWQNPRTAMARLEAARMTGRLSKADYLRYSSYGEMLMDEEAQAWWFANYGKFNIDGLTRTAYGEVDVARDIRQSRVKGIYSAASGIYAKNRGARQTAYRTAADFVADSLNLNDDGSESLIPIDVLPKVYDTVRRLSKAGVDPSEAVRAIVSPALESGIRRDLNARLSDPDYFREIVEEYRRIGTHFIREAEADAAEGNGSNWYRDLEQATAADVATQLKGGARRLDDNTRKAFGLGDDGGNGGKAEGTGDAQ